jgi:hypothetical protein
MSTRDSGLARCSQWAIRQARSYGAARQRERLHAGAPRVRRLRGGSGIGEARDRARHEVDPWRQDQSVIVERAAAGQAHLLCADVDGGCAIAHPAHAVAFDQRVVWHRQRGEIAVARQHEVRQRARDEGGVRLDQRHVDAPAGEHAHILGRRRPAIAAADHHHARIARARQRGARGQRSGQRGGPKRAQHGAPVFTQRRVAHGASCG